MGRGGLETGVLSRMPFNSEPNYVSFRNTEDSQFEQQHLQPQQQQPKQLKNITPQQQPPKQPTQQPQQLKDQFNNQTAVNELAYKATTTDHNPPPYNPTSPPPFNPNAPTKLPLDEETFDIPL